MFSDVLNILFEKAVHFIKLNNLYTDAKVYLFCRICHTLEKKDEIGKINTSELDFLFVCFLGFFFFCFLGPHLEHMEGPGLGVKSELQLTAYTTASATPDPSHVCDLHHSSWQRQIPDLLSEARD